MIVLTRFLRRIYKRTKETYGRTALKSLSYRLYSSFIVTPIVATLITKNWQIALAIGITEFSIKPFTYFIFERGWSHIRWGYKNETNT